MIYTLISDKSIENIHSIISFLKSLVSCLCGSTIELRRILSAASVTLVPNIDIDGLSLPLILNRGGFSILANGLSGFGSHGVPSTLAHSPTTLPRPMMLCNTIECDWICEFARTMDSRILTPDPSLAFGPILTFGPN